MLLDMHIPSCIHAHICIYTCIPIHVHLYLHTYNTCLQAYTHRIHTHEHIKKELFVIHTVSMQFALYAVLDGNHRGAFEKQLNAPPFPSAPPCVPHVPIPGADQLSWQPILLFPLKYSCSSKLAGFLHFGEGRSMKENRVLHHPKKNPKSVFSLRVEIPTEDEASHRTVKTHSFLNTVCAFVLICI